MPLAALPGRREQGLLDLAQGDPGGGRNPVELHRRLAARAPGRRRLACGDVAGTDLEPQRHTLGFPVEVLRPGFHALAQVELDTNPGPRELVFHL